MTRILIIDDEEDIRYQMRLLLEGEGYEIEEAGNGREGLALLSGDGKFDLVVTDVLMPDVDGITVVKQLPDLHPNTKVLAISGGGDAMPAQWSLRLTEMYGTDAVLYKPFGNQQFVDTVKRLLAVELAEN
jgi:CheY-like chemotaxis protein